MSTYAAPGAVPPHRLESASQASDRRPDARRAGERASRRWDRGEPFQRDEGRVLRATVSPTGKLFVCYGGGIAIAVMNLAICKHGSERVRGTQIVIASDGWAGNIPSGPPSNGPAFALVLCWSSHDHTASGSISGDRRSSVTGEGAARSPVGAERPSACQ